MRFMRIWDYLMRRKSLLVAFFVVCVSGFCGYQFMAKQGLPDSKRFENSTSTPITQAADNGLTLHILDENQTPVYQLTFQNNFQQAQVEIGANLLLSETYVRILDPHGNLVAGEYTKIYDQAQMGTTRTEDTATEVKYYFPETPKQYQIALVPGMKIEVQAHGVRFFSTLDGVEVTEYALEAGVESYFVTENGLRRAGWDEKQTQDVIYQQLKRYVNQQITAYQELIPEHILHNKTLDVEKKAELKRLYTMLSPEDQTIHEDFIKQLEQGGKPVITYRGMMEYKLGEVVDFLELLDVNDNEDGEIARDKISVEGEVDFSEPGDYKLTYTVTDSDGNTTQLILIITITKEKIDAPSQIPDEVRPPTIPVEDNASDKNEIATKPDQGSEAGIGAGVTDDEAVVEDIGTVWGAPEIRVDYEAEVAETDTTNESANRDAISEAETVTKSAGITQQKTDGSNGTKDDTKKSRDVGKNVFFIVLGGLVFCGLVRFIFDHYIR